MRILLCSLNFSPELTGVGKYSGEMAEWLAQRGHEVRVIAAPPYYPHWKVQKPYRTWHFTRQVVLSDEVSGGRATVIRCPLWVPTKPRAWKRVLHLVSFSFSSGMATLTNLWWKPDVLILVEPTLSCAPHVLFTSALSSAVSWLHIQDFELDAAFELGDFPSGIIRRNFLHLEGAILRKFKRVSSISQRMLERAVEKGVDPARTVYFRNWVDCSSIYPMDAPSALRRELGIPNDTVVALYSGSMGKKQGLGHLLDVCHRVQGRAKIHFVLCGDGPGKEILANQNLESRNTTILPLQPASRLNELLNLADIHLLPQVSQAADLVMPSKLTGMMASGRPVIATAAPGTELFQTVSGRGVVVPPGDSTAFLSALWRLAEDNELRIQLGRNAREYAVANLDREHVLRQFEIALLDAVQSRHTGYCRDIAHRQNFDRGDEGDVLLCDDSGQG